MNGTRTFPNLPREADPWESSVSGCGRHHQSRIDRVFVRRFIAVVCVAFLSCALASAAPPSVELRSAAMTAVVYLPDAKDGYYRSSRFDWSGMVAAAKVGGHQFFGEWKVVRAVDATDNGIGTVGEFGMRSPLGFDDAKPGDQFYKIGVGKLVRPDLEPYDFTKPYVVEPLPWLVTHGESWIECVQELPTEDGWGYRYGKRVELREDKPEMIVRYTLENTGERPISTDYYCHNFVVFDDRQLDPGISVTLDFAPLDQSPIKKVAVVDGRVLRIISELAPRRSLYRKFVDLPADAGRRIEFLNPATDTALQITGDVAPKELVFYAIGKAIAIEPFVEIHLEAGETMTWSDRYEFLVP